MMCYYPAMDKALYQRLKDEAKKRYMADLEAIKRVCELSNGNFSNGTAEIPRIPKETAHAQSKTNKEPTSLSGMVRSVIEGMNEPFTTRDVQKEIAQKYPQAEIANKKIYLGVLLRRFLKKHEVKLERNHTATTPAYYRKA